MTNLYGFLNLNTSINIVTAVTKSSRVSKEALSNKNKWFLCSKEGQKKDKIYVFGKSSIKVRFNK